MVILFARVAQAESNPVPFMNQPLVPASVAPGGPSFTLIVNGSGFVSGATVNWNGNALATTFVSSAQLTATVPAAATATAGTASITVVNPGTASASNVVFLPVTTFTPAPTFGNAPGSPITGVGSPSSVAVGDFNGDGKLDLAISDYDGNRVVVLLGNGDGSFTLAASFPATGNSPNHIAVGDFNGDGKLDLAVACSGAVTILLGNGDGTFTPATPIATSQGSIAVGDFNGDGKLDLAVANLVGNTVNILLGKGDGSFTPASSPTVVGSAPYAIAVGDFNGDSRVDLAVANAGSNNVTILLGNGDGTFTATSSPTPTDPYPTSIAVGDFNGDRKLDLAVVHENSWIGSAPNVDILLGNGDGTFTGGVSPTIQGGSYSVAPVDLNGDGKLDLVVGGDQDSTITILLGNGDGTFTPTGSSIAVGTYPQVAAGDFNGDGMMDLASANGETNGTSNSVSVLLQTPSVVGAVLSPTSLSFPGQVINTASTAQTVTLTDSGGLSLNISGITITGANSDAFAESNTCGAGLTGGASCTMSVTFRPITPGPQKATISVSDNAPGSPQNVQLSGTGVSTGVVSLSPTGLTFASQAIGTTSPPQTVVVTNTGAGPFAIFSISASTDFAEANNCPPFLAAGGTCTINVTFTPSVWGIDVGALTITDDALGSPQTVTLQGNSTGTAPPVPLINQPLVPASAAPVGVGFNLTVNGTGFLSGATVNWNDVVLSTQFVNSGRLTAAIPASDVSAGTASITVTNPGTAVHSNVVFFPVTNPVPSVSFVQAMNSPIAESGQPSAVATGDFNSDGKLDLVVANKASNDLTILLGNGDGTFIPAASRITVGSSPDAIAVADFNRDGRLDLAVANYGDGTVTILLGNGDGTFTPAGSPVVVGGGPIALAMGDFNADGKLDLAVVNYSSNSLTILLGNGDGGFTAVPTSPATLTGPISVAVGDFNGDGMLDLTVGNSGDAAVSILLGNGDGTFTPAPGSPVAVGAYPHVAAGDFNGDGNLDLAVVDFYTVTGAPIGYLNVLLGNGDGTFISMTPKLIGGGTSHAIALGDFNADGKLDVAAGYQTALCILQGNGDGTFSVASEPPVKYSASTSVGDFNGDGMLDLAVAENDAATSLSAVSIVLQVPVVALSATLTPTTLSFPAQTVNATSTPQTVTLTNTGTAGAVTISGIATTGDFEQTNNCAASLAANTACTISVIFTPSATRTRTGTLTVADNAWNSPQTVSLTGMGVEASIAITSVNPSLVTLIPGGGSQTVTVGLTETNYTGSVALATSALPSGVTPTITQPGTGNSGSITLQAAGNTALVSNQTITITASGSGVSSVTGTFSLSVTAFGGGGTTTISPLPASLFFATATAVGSDRPATTTSQTLTITNTGNAQLSFSATPSATGDFSVNPSGSTCSPSLPLATGASCTVALVFAPTQAGEQDETLTIGDNALNSPQTVMLKGFGMHGYVQDAADVPATYDGTQDCSTAAEGCALSSASSILTTFNPAATATSLDAHLTTNNGYCQKSKSVECNINWTAVPGYMSGLVNPTSIYLLPWCTVDNNLNIVQTTACTKQPLTSLTGPNYLYDQVVTNQNRVVLGLTYKTNSGSPPGTHWIVVTAPNGPDDWYVFDPAFGSATDPSTLTSLNSHLSGFTYIHNGQPATVTFTVTDVGVYALGVMPSYDVIACSPVELLITDPQGRQLGNAGSGSDVFEIPNASYSRGFPLADDTGGGPPVGDPAGTKLAHILSPVAGNYSLAVTGTATGTYALTFQATATDGTIQQTTLTGTTSQGAVAPYQVTYSPTPGTPVTVTPLPGVSLSAASLTFGGQAVGTTTQAQAVTIMSSGAAPLAVSSITVQGDFAQTNSCGTGVAAGANCTINVTFTPTATGHLTGILTVTDNSNGVVGSTQTVSLSGTGIAAATTATITAPPITYGANGLVTVSAASSFGTVTGTVTLSVDGGAPSSQTLSSGSTVFTLAGLTGGAHSLSASYAAQGNFLASSATGTLTVNKAASTTLITANTPNPSAPGQAVVASFRVTGNGLPTGNVTVTASTGESCSGTLTAGVGSCSLTFPSAGSRTLTAAYAGDGNFSGSSFPGVTQTVSASSSLSISPSSVNFGNVYLGLPAIQTVTLKNTGSASITITSVAISKSGNDPDDFKALSLCRSTLAAGKSCPIILTFTADGDNYSPSGMLIITDSAAGSPQSVPLSGTVINPRAGLSSHILNFGKQKVGTTSAAQTVTLTNTGTTSLSLSTLNIGGDFSFATGTTCTSGETLVAGANCLISVAFTPTAKGERLGSVTIKDNALLKEQIIVLSGTGN
jgi:hypothetical protein